MSGASPAYRGYRLQAMDVLHRILTDNRTDLVFCLEGIEDLDIRNQEDQLLEAIQVKSYEPLQLSHLGSTKKQKPYFQRAATLLKEDSSTLCKVVNFGEIESLR